jgi:mercuric ion transport protein
MTAKKDNTRFALAGAVVAAVAASLCCILPVLAVALGLTGFAASQFFERWRPALLGVTFALLAVGFYFAYRPRRQSCEPGSACERTPVGRWNRVILWLATAVVVVLAAFPYYSGWVAQAVASTKQSAQVASQPGEAHAVLKIEGMDCGACATLIEKNLARIPGVRAVQVSFERKQANVEYDPKVVQPSRFVKAVEQAGYKVAGMPEVRD